jgi:transposase
MAEFIMVGCDLHDETMVLKIAQGRDDSEKVTARNTSAGRGRLIDDLQARARQAGGVKILFAYEASGQGFGLYDQLSEAGVECHVLAPGKIPHAAQRKRQKTDERDAEDILQVLRGHVLAGNALPSVWIPTLQTRDDRELVRARLDAAEKSALIKTQIKCLLKRNRLVRPEHLKCAWTKKAYSWLRMISNDPALGEGTREALASLLRQGEALDKEIEQIEKSLKTLAESPRYAAAFGELTKMPGVGVVTALVFLTEMGDLDRFANRRQIGAYLGVVPQCYESGAASDRKGHITRQGQPRVRRVLCQAVWARVRKGGCDSETYQRQVERNPKHKKIAVVAAMRRLGVKMWHTALAAQAKVPSHGAGRRTVAAAPAG